MSIDITPVSGELDFTSPGLELIMRINESGALSPESVSSALFPLGDEKGPIVEEVGAAHRDLEALYKTAGFIILQAGRLYPEIS